MSTPTRMILGTALWIGPLLLVSLAADPRERTTDDPPPAPTSPKPPEKLQLPGIENPYRLSPRLYSGGDPRGIEALTALKNLGVKTIISVDGATPDVETARKLGLRYVHLPVGYDGLPRDQAVRIVKALKTLPGPVYVHCHHGLHRGPAAAAVCGLATEGWSKDFALDWMKQAGASPNYRGLYASTRDFVPPSAEDLARVGADLPERSKVAPLIETMVHVDERWDHLKLAQKTAFKPPPDLDPPHDALQLAELFRELARLPESIDRGQDFLSALEAADRHAATLEQALLALGKSPSPETRKQVEAAFLTVGKSCTACHARYRDN